MKLFTQTYLWAIQMFHVEVQGLQIFHGNVSIFLCKYSDFTMSMTPQSQRLHSVMDSVERIQNSVFLT